MNPTDIERRRITGLIDSLGASSRNDSLVVQHAKTIAKNIVENQLESAEVDKIVEGSTERVSGELLANLGIIPNDIKVEFKDLGRLVKRNVIEHLDSLFGLKFNSSLPKPDRAIKGETYDGTWSGVQYRDDPVPYYNLKQNDRARELVLEWQLRMLREHGETDREAVLLEHCTESEKAREIAGRLELTD